MGDREGNGKIGDRTVTLARGLGDWGRGPGGRVRGLGLAKRMGGLGRALGRLGKRRGDVDDGGCDWDTLGGGRMDWEGGGGLWEALGLVRRMGDGGEGIAGLRGPGDGVRASRGLREWRWAQEGVGGSRRGTGVPRVLGVAGGYREG